MVERWGGGAVAPWSGGAVVRWDGGAVVRWCGGAVVRWRRGRSAAAAEDGDTSRCEGHAADEGAAGVEQVPAPGRALQSLAPAAVSTNHTPNM
ncbi:hypothetical protein [Streptomyces sp. NRRL F-2580]|uniref:hypothetical protein n=1 Tax=Streptomyces sp. NRRL F-2580 TaxID=1463841 RepID=UPI000AE8B010|nr:hypothetical protein [Streptomyces sp. NRRL F-2580]